MPYKIIGKCKYYSYLSAAESGAFWQKQRDKVGAPISASAYRALKAGKKVTVEERQPEAPPPQSSDRGE
jgi:2-keto-3-deoxy-L-rhamnonate aldolase RhmA